MFYESTKTGELRKQIGIINHGQLMHFQFVRPNESLGEKVELHRDWSEWRNDSREISESDWNSAYGQANSYFGKKKSAAEVFGLDDVQFMKCQKCNEVWRYNFKRNMPLDLHLQMISKPCPKCGNDGKSHPLLIINNDEGAKAMEELANNRAKRRENAIDQAGRFAYLTLDDISKATVPMPTWLQQVSQIASRLAVMEDELKANILLTGKPMVDAIVSRITKLEGGAAQIHKRIDDCLDQTIKHGHAIKVCEQRIDSAVADIGALEKSKNNKAVDMRLPDAIKCTILSHDSKIPDDGKGSALVRISYLPDSYVSSGDKMLTIRVPDYVLCHSSSKSGVVDHGPLKELWEAALDAVHALAVKDCKDCPYGSHDKKLDHWYKIRDKYALVLGKSK